MRDGEKRKKKKSEAEEEEGVMRVMCVMGFSHRRPQVSPKTANSSVRSINIARERCMRGRRLTAGFETSLEIIKKRKKITRTRLNENKGERG